MIYRMETSDHKKEKKKEDEMYLTKVDQKQELRLPNCNGKLKDKMEAQKLQQTT